jgi:hypothetical protein
MRFLHWVPLPPASIAATIDGSFPVGLEAQQCPLAGIRLTTETR